MSGLIPEETIREIRERTDIVEVVSSYLPLKRSGDNHLGLCPFHSERTPSFNVNASRQIFHCFGCDAGGNVFSFLMRMEGIAFPEAVRRLGERVGVEVEDRELSPEARQRVERTELLLRINQAACDHYHRILLEEPAGEPGRRYFRERGLDGELARRFQLGYAPEAWEELRNRLRELGFAASPARELGLIRPGKEGRGDFDLFRRRVLFPIHDERGRVVAFGGRVLDEGTPKYLNSPESTVYHKSRVLYGLFQAKEALRRSGEVIVVEGYFDLLALQRAEIEQAVATCGTALTTEHGRLLKRYAERVVLLFDQDEAGRRAAFRALEVLLPEGLTVLIGGLEAGEDPDSFLRRHGPERFREQLAGARPALEVYMDEVLAGAGTGIEARARAAEQVLAMIRRLPGEIERSLYLKRLAERSGVDEGLLRRRGGASPSPGRPERPGGGAPSRPPAPPRERGAARLAQDLLLQLMLTEAGVRDRVAELGPERCFSDADRCAVAEQVLAVGGAGGPVAGDELVDRLSESQQGVLAGVLVREADLMTGGTEKLFADCRRAVEEKRLRQRSRELRDLLAEADRQGDRERRAALLAEQAELNRRLKKRESSL